MGRYDAVLGRDAAYSVYQVFKESARRFHASKEVKIEGMAEAAKSAATRSKELGQGAGFRRSFGGGGVGGGGVGGGGGEAPMEAAA